MAKANNPAAALTADLLGDTHDLAGEVPTGVVKARTASSKAAARAALYRAKHDVRPMTVNIPRALHDELDAWLKARGKNKNATIEHVIRTQILRKR